MTAESHRRIGVAERLQKAWLTRGPIAFALMPAALLFGVVTSLRRVAYRLGLTSTHHVRVPVIVVGNLITGGAGKTPTVMAIVRLLRRAGYVPGIVSRGYGRKHGEVLDVTRDLSAAQCGDEPLLMAIRTGAPLVVGRKRVVAALHLLDRYPQVDVIVSDDGLQHLQLGRNAQVIVFDERGVGNGWLLPAGPLRDVLPQATPARSLVVYNADSPSTPLPGSMAIRSLRGTVALAAWWRGESDGMANWPSLSGRPVVAAAGIARPERFFDMLRAQGLTIDPLPLPDHFDFSTLPWPSGTADVIVTEKDAIKLQPARTGSTRVWVAPLDFALDAAFEAALFELLPAPKSRHGNTPA